MSVRRRLGRLARSVIFSGIALLVPALSGAAGPAAIAVPSGSPSWEALPPEEKADIFKTHLANLHSFRPSADGFAARQPGMRWQMEFDRGGFSVRPREGGWSWGLALTRWGWKGTEQTVDATTAVSTARDQRLTRSWGPDLEEWYVNDRRGLEHGFTIPRRPAGGESEGRPLVFILQVRGDLQVTAEEGGLGISGHIADGTVVMRYDGLKVTDAGGRLLPATMSTGGGFLYLEVNEKGARYPVTVDPVAQQAFIKAGNHSRNPTVDVEMGSAVAVSGTTAVIGAPKEAGSGSGINPPADELLPEAGAAFVYIYEWSRWKFQAYLKPGNTGGGDQFGAAVAISGDTIVVGAPFEDGSGTGVNPASNESAADAGAAYVFTRTGLTWTQQAVLKPSNTGAGDRFGTSVAISGDSIVVGSPFESGGGTNVNPPSDNLTAFAGAAYVFTRSAGAWSQQAYLKASNTGSDDRFGTSVSISGDRIAVGAPNEDGSGTTAGASNDNLAANAGAAYAFTRTAGVWASPVYLKASNGEAGDGLGTAVSISGSTVIAGAPGEDSDTLSVNSVPNNNAPDSGAAYVFAFSSNNWSQQAYLKASNTGTGDRFGHAVVVDGERAVVGAPFEDGSGAEFNPLSNELRPDAGMAYYYSRSGTLWSTRAGIKSTDGSIYNDGAQFGRSVALSGDYLLVGAPLNVVDNTGWPSEALLQNGGVVCYYSLSDAFRTAGFEEIIPPTSITEDLFGTCIALSGSTLVVGAPYEDGSGSGLNPVANDGAAEAGAVYVYTRSAGVWSEQAYIKSSNPGMENYFGYSVALDGNTLAIGERYEDGSGSGVNPPPDRNLSGSGAVHVWVRNGGVWTQEAYLKSPAPGESDAFGSAVAISGDVLVAGEEYEDGSLGGVNPLPNDALGASGAAHIYRRTAGVWTFEATLKASNPGFSDTFGASVSVSGDTIVVGAPNEDGSGTGVNPAQDDLTTDAGAVYVFHRSGGQWSQEAILKTLDAFATSRDLFGTAVTISGDTVAVGAPGDDGANGTDPDCGAVYIFSRGATGEWLPGSTLRSNHDEDQFGTAVSLFGDSLAVGAPYDSSSTSGIDSVWSPGQSSGAVYAYGRAAGTWIRTAYIKAAVPGVYDGFGTSVAASGNSVAAGAPRENSGGTGVNPADNERSLDSGAVYVFNGFDSVEGALILGNGLEIPAGDTTPSVADHTDFGLTAAGAGTVNRTFTIENNGTAALNISGLTLTGSPDFSITQQPGASVAAGASTTFRIRFSPASAGQKSATVSLSNNGVPSPYTFSIKGQAQSNTPQVQVLGNDLEIEVGDTTVTTSDNTDFGSLIVGTTVEHVFTIRNDGMQPLTLGAVTVTGTHAADFTVARQPPTPVDALGGTSNFRISCTPSATGARRAEVSFTNNVAGTSPYTFSIRATGVVPEISLSGNGVNITSGDTTPSQTDATDYGTAAVAGGLGLRSYIIRNTGTGDLSIDAVAIAGANPASFAISVAPGSIVSPGGETIMEILFDPNASGVRTAEIRITSNDADENPFTFRVSGTGVINAPEVRVTGNGANIADDSRSPDPANHTDFGPVAVDGGTLVRTFTVSNTGTTDLTLGAANVSGGEAANFSVTRQPATTVPAGGSTTLDIRFDPSAAGIRGSLVSFSTNDGNENPFNFIIQGTGTVPVTTVTGGTQDQGIADGDNTPTESDGTSFGSVKVIGENRFAIYRITNTGTAPLILGTPSFSGTNSADFTLTHAPSTPVEPGASTEMEVAFDPSGSGARVASLSFTTNDPDAPVYNFRIGGMGVNPEVTVSGNGVGITDGDTTPGSTDGTDFGTTAVTGGTAVRTFTILNEGNGNLTLGTVTLGGANPAAFSVTKQPATLIAPGASDTLEITFDPASAVVRNATVTFTCDDADEGSFDFAIRGTGVANAPEITVTGNSGGISDGSTAAAAANHTDFGSIPVSAGNVVRTFTITNAGSANLTLGTVTLTGANAGDFSVTQQPASPVVAGGSTTVQITFDASAPGLRSSGVLFTCNDGDESPFNFAIQGTGTAPEIVVTGNETIIADNDSTPASLDRTDFGLAAIGGGSVQRLFTILNQGNQNLTLGTATLSGPNAADFIVAAQPPGTIAPGASGAVQVSFSPGAGSTATRDAVLSFSTNDADENPFNFSIRGTAAAPEIAVSGAGTDITDGDTTPSGADDSDFGSVAVAGGTSVRTFTISNTGLADLTVGTVTIAGTHASNFTVTQQPTSPVPGSSSTTFQITFDPSAAGLRSATLSFSSGDADENPFNFSIQGTGAASAPEINVTGNGVAIVDGDTTPSGTDFTAFGSTLVTGGTIARTFTVSNTGTASLTLAPAPVISGTNAADFTVTAGATTPVAAGGSTSFTITFNPSAAGTRSATVSFTNNDADENPFNFSIRGTGSLTAQESWRQFWFTTTANSGSAADNADPDFDGIPNLVEWACNLVPTAPGALPHGIVFSGPSIEYTYVRSVAAVDAGAGFAVQFSDTLAAGGWSTAGVTQTILADDGTVQTVRASVPLSGSGRRFVRLAVSAPP